MTNLKKIISLFLVIAILLCLCSCGYIPEEVKQEAKAAMGDALEDSLDQLKDDLKEATDLLREEVEAQLKDSAEGLSQELKDSLSASLSDMGLDALKETKYFTAKVGNTEYATLLNFPNAKTMAVLHEFPIGTKFPDPANETSSTFKLTIDGDEVSMLSMQCQAYARYIQYKLYGEVDTKNLTPSSNFYNILDDYTANGDIPAGTLTEDMLKTVITAAGPGTHLRTNGNNHSMFVVQVDEDGFTILDANADGKMTIRQYYYTWSEYMEDIFAPRGFKFVRIYDPKD